MDTQIKQRVFTGVVTQLQDKHGMVDQDVHFQMSDVIGRYPQLGEKVLVKAVKDSAQALSWTAQTVQTLNGQPFKSPPPLLPSMSSNQKPGILGRQPIPLLKAPMIPPLIPNMQTNPGKGLLQMPHHLQPPWAGVPFEGWGGGGISRKRHNEGAGGRRGGRWEDGGSWGGDGIHQKRRRWKGTPDEEGAKRSSAPQQTGAFFSCFPRDSTACESLEVFRRYPHLPLPPTLFHLQLSWTESFPHDRPFPLCGPCLFRNAEPPPKTDEAEAEAETPQLSESEASEFAVKVMLLSMPSVEDFYTQCCRLGQEETGAKTGVVHPSSLVKFLLRESKGNLQMVGGYWSAEEDGPSPAKDPSSLIRTAIRCTLQQTGLDLGACTQWHKMAELRYLSDQQLETVVLLLPDVWNLPQTDPMEEEEEQTEEQEDSAPTLPEPPALLVSPCPGSSLPVHSLASLLEPPISKTQDAFEVGLMAELFSEMLQRDFGLQLYRCLSCVPLGSGIKAEDDVTEIAEKAKVKVEPKKAEKGKKKSASKEGRKKGAVVEKDEAVEQEPKEEEEKSKDEIAEDSLAEDKKNSETADATGEDKTAEAADNHATKANDRPQGWSPVLPRSVLLSWVFFDRKLVGSMQERDVQNILLSLGLYLTPAQAMDLVKKASLNDLCQYRKLCDQWDDSELPFDISLQGNQALLPGQASVVVSKDRTGSRRSGAKANTADMVSYKGSMVSLPSLMQALEKGTAAQKALEQRVTSLQTKLVEIQQGKESEEERLGGEELRSRLEQAEKRNNVYEKNLKENAGHMIAVIERMQKMVDQTTSLTESKKAKEDKA